MLYFVKATGRFYAKTASDRMEQSKLICIQYNQNTATKSIQIFILTETDHCVRFTHAPFWATILTFWKPCKKYFKQTDTLFGQNLRTFYSSYERWSSLSLFSLIVKANLNAFASTCISLKWTIDDRVSVKEFEGHSSAIAVVLKAQIRRLLS